MSVSLTFNSSGVQSDMTVKVFRTSQGGGFVGVDTYQERFSQALTEGSGSNQISGVFSSKSVSVTGGLIIELSDDADPTNGGGSEVPSSDPINKKLKGILIINTDDTNYITVSLGGNPLGGWLNTGATNLIYPGGAVEWYSPVGSATLTGSADEIVLTASAGTIICELHYMFG